MIGKARSMARQELENLMFDVQQYHDRAAIDSDVTSQGKAPGGSCSSRYLDSWIVTRNQSRQTKKTRIGAHVAIHF